MPRSYHPLHNYEITEHSYGLKHEHKDPYIKITHTHYTITKLQNIPDPNHLKNFELPTSESDSLHS